MFSHKKQVFNKKQVSNGTFTRMLVEVDSALWNHFYLLLEEKGKKRVVWLAVRVAWEGKETGIIEVGGILFSCAMTKWLHVKVIQQHTGNINVLDAVVLIWELVKK